jgi:phosphohistidine phosphatase
MKLCLVRHGNAVDHDVDALRRLSERGREEAKQAGQFIQKVGFKPQKVFHSELVRARETATLATSEIGGQFNLNEDKDLLPNSPISTWSNNLLYLEENIMLVGHMPFMGLLATDLLKQTMALPTGGVMIFEIENGESKLVEKNF